VTLQAATAGRIRRLTPSAVVRDAAVALIAFALTIVLLAAGSTATRNLDPLGVVLAAIASLPLLARRREPLGVFALTTLASATLNVLGYQAGPPFGPTVALFFVAADERTRTRARETAAVVLGLFATHVGSAAIAERGFPTSPVLFGTFVWGTAWVIGDQLRQRRQRMADLEERGRRTEREAERERRLAVAEERNRIARDLHDSAAHAINVILVHAGGARLLQERDPDAARVAMTTIEEVARETIGEIEQLIRGLREDGARDEPEKSIEAPTGLAALETLVERHRATGLSVRINVQGRRRSLAPSLDQAAYRILQESLTNAARHGSGPADLEIVYGATQLELTITNPTHAGSAGDRVEGGHGLLGMRERAELLGGSLEAGFEDARFRVHARAPYAVGDGSR
jgi:signal transduction histidine kinase